MQWHRMTDKGLERFTGDNPLHLDGDYDWTVWLKVAGYERFWAIGDPSITGVQSYRQKTEDGILPSYLIELTLDASNIDFIYADTMDQLLRLLNLLSPIIATIQVTDVLDSYHDILERAESEYGRPYARRLYGHGREESKEERKARYDKEKAKEAAETARLEAIWRNKFQQAGTESVKANGGTE